MKQELIQAERLLSKQERREKRREHRRVLLAEGAKQFAIDVIEARARLVDIEKMIEEEEEEAEEMEKEQFKVFEGNGIWRKWEWADEKDVFQDTILPEGSKRSRTKTSELPASTSAPARLQNHTRSSLRNHQPDRKPDLSPAPPRREPPADSKDSMRSSKTQSDLVKPLRSVKPVSSTKPVLTPKLVPPAKSVQGTKSIPSHEPSPKSKVLKRRRLPTPRERTASPLPEPLFGNASQQSSSANLTPVKTLPLTSVVRAMHEGYPPNRQRILGKRKRIICSPTPEPESEHEMGVDIVAAVAPLEEEEEGSGEAAEEVQAEEEPMVVIGTSPVPEVASPRPIIEAVDLTMINSDEGDIEDVIGSDENSFFSAVEHSFPYEYGDGAYDENETTWIDPYYHQGNYEDDSDEGSNDIAEISKDQFELTPSKRIASDRIMDTDDIAGMLNITDDEEDADDEDDVICMGMRSSPMNPMHAVGPSNLPPAQSYSRYDEPIVLDSDDESKSMLYLDPQLYSAGT